MITTESSNANALRMAKLLIQNKLAACVSIKQIFSIYKWDDDIEETKEFEIKIKRLTLGNSKSSFTIINHQFLKDEQKITFTFNKRLFPKRMWRDSFNLCGTNNYAIRIQISYGS